MQRSSRRLTLSVGIFEEVVDGRVALTDDVARKSTRPFSPEFGWNATVRRATSHQGTASSAAPAGASSHHLHFETLYHEYGEAEEQATELAIDVLCRHFFTPNGRLNPHKANPNPNLFYVPIIDANSPADYLFAMKFCIHGGKNLSQGSSTANSIRPSSSGTVAQITNFACSVISSIFTAKSSIQPEMGASNAAAATLKAMGADKMQQTSEPDDRLIRASDCSRATSDIQTALTEMGSVIQLSTADPEVLREHLNSLMDAMEIITKHHGDVRRQGRFETAFTGLLVTVGAGDVAALVTKWMDGLGEMAATTHHTNALFVMVGIVSLIAAFRHMRTAETTGKDATAMDKSRKTMHRWLCKILIDALRSDYQSRRDAPATAKLVMEMVAALDPEALKGWDYRSASVEYLSRELRSLAQGWAGLAK